MLGSAKVAPGFHAYLAGVCWHSTWVFALHCWRSVVHILQPKGLTPMHCESPAWTLWKVWKGAHLSLVIKWRVKTIFVGLTDRIKQQEILLQTQVGTGTAWG